MHGDRAALSGAEPDGHEADALDARFGGGGFHLFRRLERFAVGHQHERAIGAAIAGEQQFGALPYGARNRAARLPYHRRIEIIEEEFDGPIVAGERRQDVAAAREGDQGHAIGLRHGA